MSLLVAVDFGTSSTCVAMSRNGGEPQVVPIDGHPLVSSAVYGTADGTLFVGQEAERQSAIDPSRFEPHPKRRIDEGELLLGSTVVPVLDVVHAVLARAVHEARRLAGGADVDLLVLTHPADWGALRTRVLRQAARDLARELRLVPEPVAAAVFHGQGRTLPDGAVLAVLDLGGGTVDATLVRREVPGGFQVLAARGRPDFGGADIDQLLLSHISSEVVESDPQEWRKLTAGNELADRRRRRVLRADVRGAKETLSRHTYTDVPLPPPFRDVHLTRTDLEHLIEAPLSQTTELLTSCLLEAGVAKTSLAAVFLVGGSSRIPLVARLVQQRVGVIPNTLDSPETVVAQGALHAVTASRPAMAPAVSAARAAPSPVALPPAAGHSPAPQRAAPRSEPVPPGSAPVEPPKTPDGAADRRSGRARLRKRWLVVGAAIVVLAGAGAGVWLAVRPAGDGQRIAQYDYAFTVPRGWHQTGGGEERKVQITPEGSDSPANSIVVQEFPLASGDRQRNVAGLRSALQDRGGFTGIDTDTSYAGKRVFSYRQGLDRGTIDWYVMFQGTVQVTVGCEYTNASRDRVTPACRTVVGSMTVTR